MSKPVTDAMRERAREAIAAVVARALGTDKDRVIDELWAEEIAQALAEFSPVGSREGAPSQAPIGSDPPAEWCACAVAPCVCVKIGDPVSPPSGPPNPPVGEACAWRVVCGLDSTHMVMASRKFLEEAWAAERTKWICGPHTIQPLGVIHEH